MSFMSRRIGQTHPSGADTAAMLPEMADASADIQAALSMPSSDSAHERTSSLSALPAASPATCRMTRSACDSDMPWGASSALSYSPGSPPAALPHLDGL